MANTIDQSLLGKVVSFQIYPSAIITDEFTNVRLIGLINYEVATGYIEPASMHANVYPTLPTGTPNDYRLYEYVIIRKADGKMTALGLPWIKEDTIVVAGSTDLQITIRGKSIDDIPRLRQILTTNNFTDFDISSK